MADSTDEMAPSWASGIGVFAGIAAIIGGAHQAIEAIAAIVNDLCCVGAVPLVVNAYFATGSGDWYEQGTRKESLVSGWRAACEQAGATWGGGESPTLPGLIEPTEIDREEA